MTKTPFEIRFDLINYARGQLSDTYYAAMERIRETTAEHSLERIAAMNALIYPTNEQIMALASELKEFVDSK
jgi:hypothetical protein